MPQVPTYDSGKPSVLITFFLMVLVWFGLILQFCISMQAYLSDGLSLLNALVQFFSYFTIQVNILVGLCLIGLLLKPQTKLYSFFSRGYVFTGVVFYIIIVGLITTPYYVVYGALSACSAQPTSYCIWLTRCFLLPTG